MIATAALSFCNTDELNLPNKLYEDLKVHLTLRSLSLIACPLGNFPRKSTFKTAMFLFVKLGIQTLMESHKASFFHEQIYLENFQFIKYSSFTVIIALTNLLQLLKPTQFQPPFLKKYLLKETKIKRFTKRYGQKCDKKNIAN